MKPTIWIFSIESLETRYTKQWHAHVPELLSTQLGNRFNIVQVDGIQLNTTLTPGAFLNFSDTNYWKSSQLCNFLDHHNSGKTSANDHFIFADAWNPTVVQLKYMSALLGFNWTLHGLWHAGNYDKNDFLGRLKGDTSWVTHAEKSFYHAYDHNYFATDFHIKMFCETLLGFTPAATLHDTKIVRTGWPMEYMSTTLAAYKNMPKRDLVLFPHRIACEKQVEIFRDLKQHLPQYEFVVCQDQSLTKHQYHTLLGEAKLVFSANLQETLGISTCSEAPLVAAMPLAPNRLSYVEIFQGYDQFLYPSEWTLDFDHYVANRSNLVEKIVHLMDNYETLVPMIEQYVLSNHTRYFSANELLDSIK